MVYMFANNEGRSFSQETQRSLYQRSVVMFLRQNLLK